MADENQEAPQQEVPPPTGEQQVAPAPVIEPQQPDFASGIQRRIDELTARFHDSQRQVDAKDAQITELVAALTARSVPQEPDLLADVDPADQRRVRAIVSPEVKRLEEMVSRLEQAQQQQAFAAAAAKFGDERVTTLATRIQEDWSKRRMQGWTPTDALYLARGIVAQQDAERGPPAPAQRDQRGRFVPPPQSNVLGTQAAPPPAAPRPKDELPGNIDDLIQTDPVRAMALLEKRLDGKKF